MKKNIGDKIKHVSPFGYEFTATVTGILQEGPDGNAYEVEYDPGKPRKIGEGEMVPLDNNLYWPKVKPTDEVRFVAVVPPAGKYN